MSKENEWIPDGFQVVELLQEHRDNQRQQGILFDDDETNENYDKVVSEALRIQIPELQLIADLFGNFKVLSDVKHTTLVELDVTPDGSESATENDGRTAWEWSSSLSDRSIWLDANYDNLDAKSNACSECYIEFSRTGQCNCA
jgi:hypothetical protein